MTEPDDTLADLRDAFRHLRPPAPGSDLAAEPVDVQRAVTELRAAWRALEAPPVQDADIAALLRTTRRHRPRWRNRVRLVAVAAVVIVGVGLAVYPDRFRDPPPVPEPGSSARAGAAPRVLIATAERVEMRAGPVHLVLVRPETPARTAGETGHTADEGRDTPDEARNTPDEAGNTADGTRDKRQPDSEEAKK